jgi:cytochrome c-type biogenesis protein
MNGQSVSLAMAFSGGLLSFASPCVLPLVPSYIGYITGLSFEELTNGERTARVRMHTAINGLLFILGFSTMFTLMGASASAIGQWLLDYQHIIRIAGGALVVLFGLYVAGWLKWHWLSRERRVHLAARPAGFVGTFLVGMVFAAGWTPCVGPILAGILTMAASAETTEAGGTLLLAYSFGLGLPLFLSAIAVEQFLTTYRRLAPYLLRVSQATGVLLILIGLLLMTNSFAWISEMATAWSGSPV